MEPKRPFFLALIITIFVFGAVSLITAVSEPPPMSLATDSTGQAERSSTDSPQIAKTSGFGLRELKLAPRFTVSTSQPAPKRKSKTSVGLSKTGLDAQPATGSIILGEHDPPDPCEYLGEAPPEIVFTQEIIDTAADLGHDPRRIYEFVRNGFDYEVYYGSLKGAHETLMQGCGNDCDLASLLVALLRVSGIPARYVYGSVDIPIDKAQTWVGGVEDPMRVADTLVSFGTPSGSILSGGGQPIYVRTDHFWVEAWVDYIPHRGAVKEPNAPGDTWIPLDPGFKEYVFYDPNVNIFELVKFDLDGYLSSVKTGDAVDYYMDQIDSYVDQNLPGRYTHEFAKAKGIISQNLNILPGSLPHILRYWDNVAYLLQPITDPPMDQFRHKVTVTIGSASYQISLPELSGKRLTVYYIPATPTDANIIESYGGLYETPAGAVNLKPVIRLDGVEKARGSAIAFGDEQTLSFGLSSPNGEAGSLPPGAFPPGSYPPVPATPQDGYFSKIVKSGEFHSLVFPYASGNGGGMMEMSKRLNGRIDDIGDAFLVDGYLDDELTGDFLTLRGKSWYQQVYLAKTLAAAFMQRYFVSDIGGAVVSVLVDVDAADVNLSGLLIDAPRNLSFILPRPDPPDSDPNSKDFMLLVGYAASALEHYIWEQKYGLGGISTVKCLQLANEQSQTIYDIDSSNIGSILPLLPFSQDVKDDIQAVVNNGQEVKIHSDYIDQNDWYGCGYAVTDPVTGVGRFQISDGCGGKYIYPENGKGDYWSLVTADWTFEEADEIHLATISKHLSKIGYSVHYKWEVGKGTFIYELLCRNYRVIYIFCHGGAISNPFIAGGSPALGIQIGGEYLGMGPEWLWARDKPHGDGKLIDSLTLYDYTHSDYFAPYRENPPLFVFVNACYSAHYELTDWQAAFISESFLGWDTSAAYDPFHPGEAKGTYIAIAKPFAEKFFYYIGQRTYTDETGEHPMTIGRARQGALSVGEISNVSASDSFVTNSNLSLNPY